MNLSELQREWKAITFLFIFFAVGEGAVALTGASDSPLGEMPASFVGDLPCADCPGVRYQLDLFEDGVFYLRMTYLERDRSFDDIGRWSLGADGKMLVLSGGREAPVKFAVLAADRLRKLDLEGRPIESKHNYDLLRYDGVEALEPRLLVRGMYRYRADAGLFTECLTGRRFPVAQEADNVALERAYLAARQEPGEELLVSVEGRITRRAKMEGEGEEPALMVKRFVGVFPGATCGGGTTSPALAGTYWKLLEVGGRAVPAGEARSEPHIVLESKEGRLGGSGGCNRFTGTYELAGEKLTFGPIASTRMACLHGMDLEAALTSALGKVQSWKIEGRQLDLFDESDTRLARFEAKAQP